eukprot:TRINITY_DN780_c0_g1_i4.p1 TRINITY_DN780_c0_g1~~TRINITY_DN780_c0_g1_i4.p1  ORF type:complete len:111 (-),score=25.04 TRINITY_DN780_c0_g1_i4:1978-2310(-)
MSNKPVLRKKHVQSKQVTVLLTEIRAMEEELKRLSIPVTYPNDLPHIGIPMLGHTKGNTKNNRKKIKHQQKQILEKIHVHLTELLPDGCPDPISDDLDFPSSGQDSSSSL